MKNISYNTVIRNTKLTSYSTPVEGEKTKMAYDPKNAVEGEDKPMLPKDSILDAVIISVKDGEVKDFIPESVAWQGERTNPAINVTMEVKVEGQEPVPVDNLFTYFTDEEGKTVYTPRSNLGKYFAKYKKLPEAGDQVKVFTTEKGYGKIKID